MTSSMCGRSRPPLFILLGFACSLAALFMTLCSRAFHTRTLRLNYLARYASHATPLKIVAGSHISPGYVEHKPLQELLFDAFDGGETLRPDLWHPCHAPQFHEPHKVVELASAVEKEFDVMLSQVKAALANAYRMDIGGVVALFSEASARGLYMVSTLDFPHDRERASKVELPFPCEQPDLDDFLGGAHHRLKMELPRQLQRNGYNAWDLRLFELVTTSSSERRLFNPLSISVWIEGVILNLTALDSSAHFNANTQ